VIVGFLFTAGRQWSGQPTPTGMALAALFGPWALARVLGLVGALVQAARIGLLSPAPGFGPDGAAMALAALAHAGHAAGVDPARRSLGMMTRTARGHTRQMLRADRWDIAIYAAILSSGVLRYGPWLMRPRIDERPG
jgi:uncharacterized protein involved in response to NO